MTGVDNNNKNKKEKNPKIVCGKQKSKSKAFVATGCLVFCFAILANFSLDLNKVKNAYMLLTTTSRSMMTVISIDETNVRYLGNDIVIPEKLTMSNVPSEENNMTIIQNVTQQQEEVRNNNKQRRLEIFPTSIFEHLKMSSKVPVIPSNNNITGMIFYPRQYFENGPGRAYNSSLSHYGYNYYAAAVGGMYHCSFENFCQQQQQQQHQTISTQRQKIKRYNLIVNLLMKCGSSSIENALETLPVSFQKRFPTNTNITLKCNGILRSEEASEVLIGNMYNNTKSSIRPLSMTTTTTVNSSSTGNDNSNNSNNSNNNNITTTTTSETFTYISTIRDPISRFVSATAQEMYEHHPGKASSALRFKRMCLKETGTETLQCSINHIKQRFTGKKGFVNKPHFIPMSVVLLRRTYGHDVGIELYDMSKLDDIVKEIYPPSKIRRGNIERFNEQDGKAPNNSGRDKTGGSDVLKNLSINDLTSDMIDEICSLYTIDVLMLQSIGIATPYCVSSTTR